MFLLFFILLPISNNEMDDSQLGSTILKVTANNLTYYTPPPPETKLVGRVYWIHPVCPSVRLSVCFRPVASTFQDGFFPYLIQMINSMRVCVLCDDPWPWPISSRSFDLDFENRVRSVTFSVLDRLFPYLPQIIITIRGCVAGGGGGGGGGGILDDGIVWSI